VVMKKIVSSSYVESQMQTLRFDPSRLQGPPSNPRIKSFQNAFNSLGLVGMNVASESDAMILVEIQDKIRKKLRGWGVQVGM